MLRERHRGNISTVVWIAHYIMIARNRKCLFLGLQDVCQTGKVAKKNQNFLEQMQVHFTVDIIPMWREGVSNSHTCYAFYWWQLLLKKPKDSSFSSGTWTEFSRVRHDNRAHWQPKWVQWSHYSTFIVEKHDCDTSHLTRFTFSWMSFFVSL